MTTPFKWIFFPLERKTYNIHYVTADKIIEDDYNFLLYLSRLGCDNIISNDSFFENSNVTYDSTLDIHTITKLRKNTDSNITILLNMDKLLGDENDPNLPLDYPIKLILFNLFYHGILDEKESTFHLISYGKYQHHYHFYYNRMDQVFIKNFSILQKYISTYYFWKNTTLQIHNNCNLIYHIHSHCKEFDIQYIVPNLLPNLLIKKTV